MPAYSNLPFGVRAVRFINQLPIRGRTRFVSWLLRRFSYFHEQRVTLGSRTVYADFRQAMCFGLAVRSLEDEEQVLADDLGRVNQAFFQVNAVISIGLFVLVLVQLAVKW